MNPAIYKFLSREEKTSMCERTRCC